MVEEIAAVREATTGTLKVIIESAALTDEEIVTACRAAEEAGPAARAADAVTTTAMVTAVRAVEAVGMGAAFHVGTCAAASASIAAAPIGSPRLTPARPVRCEAPLRLATGRPSARA